MRLICPKHSVKPVVLLFHLIEYPNSQNLCKSQSQEVLVLVYVATGRDTVAKSFAVLSRHFHTKLLFAAKLPGKLHFLCAATTDTDCTVCSTVVATAMAVEGRQLL
ncbi:hypothetical protein TNIN_129151 [Trichonephila inaurata madagascariensis]|uniref:Uncharacterized protein n=1 Tax=Trichonephila inaurata madagascariensis TaxID=2747483 RepID=A0A8X7CRD1_9ARAC|nr:hypothetical protein TNIN_129151 [Trichonephila inaurata madagascariensis]